MPEGPGHHQRAASGRQPGALTAALGYYRVLDLPGAGGDGSRHIAVPTTVLWGMRDRCLTAALLGT